MAGRPQGPLSDSTGFADCLVKWFERHARDDPWRRTTDPYAILVSEMMLQQTRVATVLQGRYFERWMERFPDVRTLAAASTDHVLAQWSGLGYYRRARFLQKTAQAVVEKHGGVFPSTLEELLSLPGVGGYTAAAVASFAFNQSVPLVDGNVARVLARLLDFREEVNTPRGHARITAWAGELVPPGGARTYNAALMELGQTVCRVGRPDCLLCPVKHLCLAQDPASLPLRKAPSPTIPVEESVLFVTCGKGVYLQLETGSRRNGLWKLPALPEAEPRHQPACEFRYTITRHRVRLRVFHGTAKDDKDTLRDARLIRFHELDSLAMGAPYRKALARLLPATKPAIT
jgi:A/G-specific adenine glycosylase